MTHLKRLINSLLFQLAVFTFLFNFVWEMAQAPFYFAPQTTYLEVLKCCATATLGDVAISIFVYFLTAVWIGSGDWGIRAQRSQMMIYVAIGILITVLLEMLFTRVWIRWTYLNGMPVIPLLRVGLLPVLQWALIPPIVIWYLKRQVSHSLRGRRQVSGASVDRI